MTERQKRLVILYEEMSRHTAPECASACPKPHSCCNGMYCEITIGYAKQKWGVDLPRTSDPRLPLMGPTGCTAAPHLRPICTVHTCDINSMGTKPWAPAWTERYFDLRERINELEGDDAEPGRR